MPVVQISLQPGCY